MLTLIGSTIKETTTLNKQACLNNPQLIHDYKLMSFQRYYLKCLLHNWTLPKSKTFDFPYVINDIKSDYSKYDDIIFRNFFEKWGHYGVCYCNKINTSNKGRIKRLKSRIDGILIDAKMIGEKVYFITFTFSDEYIAKTMKETRRKVVRRLLKKYCRHYVANIDFGEDEEHTHREHYHAICETNDLLSLRIEYTKLTGSIIDTKIVRNNTKSVKKLSCYITKLCSHALKESTHQESLIYDRNKEYETEIFDLD